MAGQWQHIAWVFDINAVRLYIDGNLIGRSFASGSFRSNDRPFSIGKSLLAGYNFIYGGRADEVSLWNKALTQAEIQDMMANELAGTETDLVVYYKFDQGAPEGDNRSITQLNAYGGLTDRNADLYNFALTGSTSNFAGTLEPSFQTISIPPVSNKLTTDGPFDLGATASSGLPVLLEVLSGPASVNGDSVVLDGISSQYLRRQAQTGLYRTWLGRKQYRQCRRISPKHPSHLGQWHTNLHPGQLVRLRPQPRWQPTAKWFLVLQLCGMVPRKHRPVF